MYPKNVVIKEVGPRDGLQNEREFVPTEQKIELINRLSKAGFKHIEVSSFVNPKWIPALQDASDVFAGIVRLPDVEYSALVPNEQGLSRALAAKVDAISVFMSATESHNKKNINKSIDETFPVLAPVVEGAKAAGLPVRGYVSTVFGCPYEGSVEISQVLKVTEKLLELGVDEVSLGDTIGVATPNQVDAVVRELGKHVPLSKLALHFHDTRGTALANVLAGMQAGIHTFDSSLGGLGGCPYAPGASGNVATDDLLYMLTGMGIDTGIDSEEAMSTAIWFERMMKRPLASHALAVARASQGGNACE